MGERGVVENFDSHAVATLGSDVGCHSAGRGLLRKNHNKNGNDVVSRGMVALGGSCRSKNRVTITMTFA